MKTLGVLCLFIRIGNLGVWDHLLVPTILATSYLLGTTSIDKHVMALYLQQNHVSFRQSRAVYLLSASMRAQSMTIQESFPTTDNPAPNKIVLTRAVIITSMTQAEVHVTVDVGALFFLQVNPKTVKKRIMLMASVVMERISRVSSHVVLSNIGNSPIHLTKNTIVRLTVPVPVALISKLSFVENDESKEGAFTAQNKDPNAQELEIEVV